MIWRETRAEYVVKNFEHGPGVSSSGKSEPAIKSVRPAILLIRARTAVRMAREIFAHEARRLSFMAKADRIILCQRVPALKRIFDVGTAESARRPIRAFTRALRANAKAGYHGARRVTGKPGVRAHALPVSVGAAAVCAIFFLSTFMTSDLTYYEYSYGGKVLGLVKDKGEVYGAINRPETKRAIDERAGASVVLDADDNIEVRKVVKLVPSDVPVDDEDDIVSNIASLKDIDVVGQAVIYDGENIGTVANADEADRLLERLKARCTEDEPDGRFSEVGFVDEVTLTEVMTTHKNIETPDEVFARLARTSFSAIEVRAVEIVHYEEEYEETPIYIDDDERYEDYEFVITPGAAGLRKVTANSVYVNGSFSTNEPISYEVIRPAVAAHMIRGTRKLPASIGSGRFIRPAVGGVISSPFGPRWGRMHEGVDINIKYAPVYAAGDGKVVYTGTKGGYGVAVIIDHGDGFETLYGHLSRFSVKAGEEVHKGQRIATSGNTGRSTGAHLHFEVRVNGTPRNPLDYL